MSSVNAVLFNAPSTMVSKNRKKVGKSVGAVKL